MIIILAICGYFNYNHIGLYRNKIHSTLLDVGYIIIKSTVCTTPYLML